MEDAIPFNRATLLGDELDHVREAINSRKVSGDGAFTKLCNAWLEERLGAAKALLTHSCTAALEMAALLCDLKAGDEVIMPSFTFVSTANAVVLRGATPVFVDIDPETFNVCPSAIAAAVSKRTRAIFVVHYGGVPCDMDAINAVARRRDLLVVEDAAQALGSRYKGREVGALADMAAFSFHETKNLNSGEGGALVLAAPRLAERAEIIREKGTNRSCFLRGQVDKYTWVDIGSSYLPSDILAAYLFPQLRGVDFINLDRLASWARYHEGLSSLESTGQITRPKVPDYADHNGHIYSILLDGATDRDDFLTFLSGRGVNAAFHYVPLHSSPAGRKYGRTHNALPVTGSVAERLVRLPLYYGMGEAACDRVIEVTQSYFAR